jgi:hypothetical protein
MITHRRLTAMRWFDDHSREQNSVMGQRVPTKYMRNLMIRDGHLQAIPTGSFGHLRFELTSAGRALLASKPRRKKKSTKEANDDEHGHDDEQQREAAGTANASPGE